MAIMGTSATRFWKEKDLSRPAINSTNIKYISQYKLVGGWTNPFEKYDCGSPSNLPNTKTHWKTPENRPPTDKTNPRKNSEKLVQLGLAHLFKFFGELGVLLEAERPNLGSCEAWFSWSFLACLRMPGWLGCLETENQWKGGNDVKD